MLNEQNIEYYFYFNWTAKRGKKAIIHRGDCPFCNYGRGIHKNKTDKHGRWSDLYPSKQLAYEAVKKLNPARLDFCKKEK